MSHREELEALIDWAKKEGCQVRLVWLGGDGGGMCTVRGERHLLIDLGQSPAEQILSVRHVLGKTAPETVAVSSAAPAVASLGNAPRKIA